MSGYLHFKKTGVKAIDTIADALESAGNSYHNTDMWAETMDWLTPPQSHKEIIQNALDAAALSSPAPVEANGCPSCAAVGATWIDACDNPIHIHQANAYIHTLEDKIASIPPAPVWNRKKPNDTPAREKARQEIGVFAKEFSEWADLEPLDASELQIRLEEFMMMKFVEAIQQIKERECWTVQP